MQVNDFERILAKTVGLELSTEEMELVAGGRIPICLSPENPYTTLGDDGVMVCDAM